MHDLLIAFFLGTIQGLTEFLPVSSSGHLAILQGFIGDRWLGDVLFNVSVHLGTTLAVIVFFYKDLLSLIRGILPGTYQRQQMLVIVCLMITTVITGTIGILFKDTFEAMFSLPKLAAGMLIITGFLTFFTDRIKKYEKAYGEIRIRDAVIIGLFQSLAIIPGISRSGSTIFAGVFCGMERTWAASYSFIAAIPAIIGAAVLEWGDTPQNLTASHIMGAATAFIVGLISLKFLVWTLKKHNFIIFSIYCWLAGLLYIALSL
ncbi:MAG TPA: undecaprenyl-diphosphate phosphatase [Deltaproteobacteria bacterium]|nr:undecaprenyl-diphosphate phosphatase [Deltaproteobacteria bacterium]HPJ92432.1 undecaprenyl-diphosphate phosphatase [Deltaproteobacteria bacterium]HPR50383.1 undecaprenyl-diphosphate phosphatase [Deltaproteobacteria bacterium]